MPIDPVRFAHILFCGGCENILPQPTGNPGAILKCDCCGQENRDVSVDHVRSAVTQPSDFPSPLRQRLSNIQAVERHKIQTERVDANTDCPKCGTRGIRYSEVQQRSADEGSTIIYNCDCGHKWSVNN